MAPVTALPSTATAVVLAAGAVAVTEAVIWAAVLAAPPTTIRCDGVRLAGLGGAGSVAWPAYSASCSSAWAVFLTVGLLAAASATVGVIRPAVVTTETMKASVGRDLRLVLLFARRWGPATKLRVTTEACRIANYGTKRAKIVNGA